MTNSKASVRVKKDGTPWTYSPSRGQLKKIANLPRKPKTLKEIPQHEKEQNLLAEELVAWAKKDDSLNLKEFPIYRDYPVYAFYLIGLNNPYFAAALEQAREIIGMRIHKLALTGKINANYSVRFQPLYDKEYRDYLDAIQTKKDQNASTHITVQMQPIENSSLVPVKEIEE